MTNIVSRHPRFSIWPIALAFNALLLAVCVFVVTQEVKQHEASITQFNRQILAEQQTMRVLEAEWAYLTRPQRLEELMAMRDGRENVSASNTMDPDSKASPSVDVTSVEPASGKIDGSSEAKPKDVTPVVAAKPTRPQAEAKAEIKEARTQKPVPTPDVSKKKELEKQTKQNREPDIVWSIKRPVALPKQAQLTANPYPVRAGVAKPILE